MSTFQLCCLLMWETFKTTLTDSDSVELLSVCALGGCCKLIQNQWLFFVTFSACLRMYYSIRNTFWTVNEVGLKLATLMSFCAGQVIWLYKNQNQKIFNHSWNSLATCSARLFQRPSIVMTWMYIIPELSSETVGSLLKNCPDQGPSFFEAPFLKPFPL